MNPALLLALARSILGVIYEAHCTENLIGFIRTTTDRGAAAMTRDPSTFQRLMALSAGLAAGSVACLLAFEMIGSRVDSKGVLREPFGLLPISALLLLGSGTALTGAWAARGRKP